MFDRNDTPIPTRRSRSVRAILASACLFATLAWAAPAALAEAVARQVQGSVEIGQGEPPQWRPLAQGESISPDDRIRTGADGRVEITMAAGTLRVHENSMLRLPPAGADADRVDLERGNSLFDILRRGGRRFEVHTPTVVVSVKGTRFSVDARGDVGEVAVFHGVVGVRAAGSEDTLETLVREGFLATAGGGAPIELDLAPTGDPWASWQDFQREVRDLRQGPTRGSEVDRARSALHRATTVEVIERAAQRKPEVAERLQDMKKQARQRMLDASGAAGAAATDAVPAAPAAPIPAAPDIGPDLPPGVAPTTTDPAGAEGMLRRQLETEMMQGAMQRQRRDLIQERKRQERFLEEMTSVEDMLGSTPLANGETNLDTEALEQQQGQVLLDVLSARAQVEATYMESVANGPGSTSWTEADFMNEMTDTLVNMGYDPTTAGLIVDQVTGN